MKLLARGPAQKMTKASECLEKAGIKTELQEILPDAEFFAEETEYKLMLVAEDQLEDAISALQADGHDVQALISSTGEGRYKSLLLMITLALGVILTSAILMIIGG